MKNKELHTAMSVSLNPERDIGAYIDADDDEYGTVLATAHLHPELGARPSEADYNANRIIRNYLQNMGHEINPFFLIYNAERGNKPDSISVYQFDTLNGGKSSHIRHPSIFLKGNMQDPNLVFYDTSK